MKLGQFVTTSALLLAGWLALTFVREVPSQRYPKLRKHAAFEPRPSVPASTATVENDPGDALMHVSISH